MNVNYYDKLNDNNWSKLHCIENDCGFNGEITVQVETKLCYNMDDLYVMVRSTQQQCTNRDRAYQNGDGFHFVLSKTQSMPAKEFFVVAVSSWSKENPVFIWYRNMKLEHYYLDKAKVHNIKDNKYYYHIVSIKWCDLEWCQPALTSQFGFNISYVEARNEYDKVTYILVDDENIQGEESYRNYKIANLKTINMFNIMNTTNASLINCVLQAKHVFYGEKLSLKILAAYGESCKISVKIYIDNEFVSNESIEYDNIKSSYKIVIPKSEMIYGGHNIKVQFSIKNKIIYEYEDDFSVLNKGIVDIMNNQLKELVVHDELGESSVNTLNYMLKSIEGLMANLLPYESGGNIIEETKQFYENVELMKAQGHIFRSGLMRYAFISDYDGTFQPYTMWLPEIINRETKIFVYLHGSGADDRGAFSKDVWQMLAKRCNLILIAPHGRGVSNCYCPIETRKDIEQLILMCAKLFGIEGNKAILSGFSMGGYGVLRVYDGLETVFHRLIIMSGSPDLGVQWECKFGKDYINDNNIEILKCAKIMIMHSKNDLNCPYNKIEEFVSKIKDINNQVTFLVNEKSGHSSLTEDTLQDIIEFCL